MSLGRITDLAGRILQQFRHDRRTLALVFLAPLFVMTILYFVLNSSGSSLNLGVVPPSGPAGTVIVTALRDNLPSELKDHLTISTIDRANVDATLKDGTSDGVLVFPDDFASQLAGGNATVTLRLEGSNPAVASQLRQLGSLMVSVLGRVSLPSGAGASLAAPAITLDTTWLYGGPEFTQTDSLAPLLVGLFAFFFVFLLTAVAFLRERSGGTLERLLVSPLSRAELVIGYVVGFTLFALVQSLVILGFVIYVLRVHYRGDLPLIFLVTVTLTIVAVNMGIYLSAFARNELQIVQFIPLVLVPQSLLGGLFFPVSTLPPVLHQLAYVMPLTYANFALRDVMIRGLGFATIWPDLAFLAGFALLMVVMAALTLRNAKI
ncbi:MAG TPA: ABC transporter permease [Ktedonobacterales bacterium]